MGGKREDRNELFQKAESIATSLRALTRWYVGVANSNKFKEMSEKFFVLV